MQTKNLQLKRALRSVLIVLLLCVAGMTKAYAVTIGDLNYTLNSSTLTATVTGHKDGTAATGSLIIPSSVTYGGQTYSVTSIYYQAFYHCSGLTGSLTIPNSVTSLGSFAFAGCSGFTGDLIIPNSVTNIGMSTFSGCVNFSGSLTIPNSVTEIGAEAFGNCSFIDLNTNMTYAFSFGLGAYFTGSLNLGSSVTTIDNFQHSGFTGSLTIPNSVTMINDNAFDGCSGFTGSLTIPNSVTSIGNYTFRNCSGFTGSLTIPNSVTDIGKFAFKNCTNLSAVHYNACIITEPSYYNTYNGSSPPFEGCGGTLTIGNSVETIPPHLFKNGGFIGSLIIPNSVTSLGSFAFAGCSGFTGDLTIPNSVTTIGNYAFQNCSGFTGGLTIPNSVTTIGNWAFFNCSGFTGGLTIPNSVTTIGNWAFFNCSGFTGGLTIPNSVTTIDDYAFQNCSSFTEIHYNAVNCADVSFSPFSGCSGVLTIGDNVERIPNNMFNNCQNFTGNLIIPNSVTTIGNYAFQNCSGFTGSLTIGNSVTTIGQRAFYNCTDISSMNVLVETPPTLGSNVFYNVDHDIIVHVPCNAVEAYQTVSGWNQFANIMGLCVYEITAILNPAESGTVTGAGTFDAGENITLIASANSGFTFINWTEDGRQVSIDTQYSFVVTEDRDLVANFTDNPVYLTIFVNADDEEGGTVTGGGVYLLGQTCTLAASPFEGYSFINWTKEGIVVSTSLDYSFTVMESANYTAHFSVSEFTIGDLIYAFNSDGISVRVIGHVNGTSATGLLNIPESVTFENTTYQVTRVGKCAFSGCSGFTGSLTLPASIVEIDSAAFLNCSGFSGDLTIGETVSKIGPRAFANCTGFTSLHYNATDCESIGYNEAQNNWTFAFYGNTSLQEIVIGDNVTRIPKYTFANHGAQNCQLTLSNSLETIGYGAFYNSVTSWLGLIGALEIPNSVIRIEDRAFYGCRGLTGELEIPNAVTKIGANAFLQCSGFTGNLIIPNSVDTIGVGAFIDCSGFSDMLVIGTGVSCMDQSAFRRCLGITKIQYNAFNCQTAADAQYPVFNEMSNLNKIVIGENVGFLPDYLFANCYSTLFINSYAEVPPIVGGTNAFFGIDKEISVGVPCGSLEVYQSAVGWNEFTNFQEICTQSQTITLSPGWNWFSTNVEITLDDLKAALVEALPGTKIAIKSKSNGSTAYNGRRWKGQLNSLDVAQMYMIGVPTDCEITLEGEPINPAEHPVTIHYGANWIGFPLSESMTVRRAFGRFPVAGDVIKSQNNGTAKFNGTKWVGTLKTLEPGKGYIYMSKVQETRIFTFPTSAK